MSSITAPGVLPLKQAKALVEDLMTPQPWRYALDLGASAAVGWAAFVLAGVLPAWSPGHLVAMAISTAAMFRALMFIHPTYHLPKSPRRWMRWLFNGLAGIPLLVPFFMFEGSHGVHHKKSAFGTHKDPEYRAFSTESPLRMALLPLLGPLAPAVGLLRFGLLVPLSCLHPRWRALFKARMSTLTLRPDFERDLQRERGKSWDLEEFLGTLWVWAGVAGHVAGILTVQFVLQWYVVGVLCSIGNSMQIFVLHRYVGHEQAPTLEEQILDSNNVNGRFPWLTALWAPVGQRFHALHHLFPSMPYHSMAEAHRRLMQHLPEGCAYKQVEVKSYWAAFSSLWRRAWRCSSL